MPNPPQVAAPVANRQAKPEDEETEIHGDTSVAKPNPLDQDTEKAVHQSPAAHVTPDGGLAAWSVVLGAWCTSFCSFGWMNSIGIFQEYYQNELLKEYSPSTVAWIQSLEIFFLSAMGPIVGTMYDHFGPRWLLLLGSFLHVFGLMMASLGTEYYQILLSQGICSGLGISLIFLPSISCVTGWFSKKRGAAFGIFFTGASIGGIVFPIMVANLMREVGYAWTMRSCAFLMLFLLIIANMTLRTNHAPFDHKRTLADFVRPLQEVEFVLVMAGYFLYTFGYFIPLNYLTVHATEAGLDSTLVQSLIPVLSAASLLGRLLAGFASDRFGVYRVFVAAAYLTSFCILALWIPATTPATIFAFAILFGFFSGAYVSLVSPLVMQVSPLAEVGLRTGIVFFAGAASTLTGNPIAGAMLATPGAWLAPKLFAGLCCICGTTVILAARLSRRTAKL